MDTNLFHLEQFPNEILFDIFKNLDIQDLFRAFYNLNYRFNALLHSFNNVSFTISRTNYNDLKSLDFPIQWISTLNINVEMQVDLERFTNIRCLILSTATLGQIQQLNIYNLPYLKYLSIDFPTQSFQYSMTKTVNKIFSNGFPQIESCYLPRMETIIANDNWSQVPSLRKLKVGKINLSSYKAILTACPNLYYLKFIKSVSEEILSPSEPHINLKKMTIVSPLWCPDKQSDISVFLSYVPNLEQLSIRHAEYGAITDEYLSNDWLASSITNCLPLLQFFIYYLEICYLGLISRCDIENNLNQIKEDFKKVHSDYYQSRLVII